MPPLKLPGREKAAADSLWWQVRLKNLQSNRISRSQEIEQIASTLIRDSSLAVESMQSMQQIITSQSESMAETQNIVKEVLGEINSSMQSIKQIKASTRRLKIPEMKSFRQLGNCPELRKKMWKARKNLRWNTGSCRNVPAGICKCLEQLREISDKLVKGIGYFHI